MPVDLHRSRRRRWENTRAGRPIRPVLFFRRRDLRGPWRGARKTAQAERELCHEGERASAPTRPPRRRRSAPSRRSPRQGRQSICRRTIRMRRNGSLSVALPAPRFSPELLMAGLAGAMVAPPPMGRARPPGIPANSQARQLGEVSDDKLQDLSLSSFAESASPR